MLVIFLFSYLYPKLAKTLYLSYYLFNKIGEEGRIGSPWKWEVGRVGVAEVEQTMYTHISECKNDEIKGEREKEITKKKIK
jgi:hypothetical protein